MKRLVHAFILTGITLSLIACGEPKETASGFQKAISETCANAAQPQQFVVKNRDGSIEIVRAESREAFISGYMKKHADRIQFAEHDYAVKIPARVKSQSAGSGPTTADNWGVARIGADKLWANNQIGSQVVVAVVDSGVDVSHAKLASQIDFNLGEYGPDGKGGRKENNGIDDDGNGYADDYAGWNFTIDKPLVGDNQYHGTHVAGIIAAYHNDRVAQNAPYVQGVAPGAKILPLAFLNNEGSGNISDAVRAVRYAVQRGAKVINASWGGGTCSLALREEIAALAEKNIAFIAAAGNDSLNIDLYPEYPAALNLPSQITVGATGEFDYMAQYSNYGARAVHIFAPGSNIVSTLPNNSIGFLSGTSMAAPFVSGAMALLWGAVPDATVDQLRRALYASAVHYSDYKNVSQGRMDLAQALSELQKLRVP